MKILTICQYYYPEPFRITDICEELVKRGHEVSVITGLPNYPMGRIYDGYTHGERKGEVLNGVKIHRCFTIGRRANVLSRFLNYYTYAFASSLYIRKLASDYDVVFVNQLSPVMMANAGGVYKRKYGKPLLLYCLDLWPESLIAGGVKQGSVAYRFFHRVSSKIYHSADKILVTSKSFSKYFADHFGIDNTVYLPQYAEAMFTPEQCIKAPNETIDLMFAGNLGVAQSVDTIVRAAALTIDIRNLKWHIVGDGSELENLKGLSRKLNTSNLIFHGRKPLHEMPKYYAMADAMIVTMQKDPILGLTLPGKVQTYMAAGKPILGAIDGEAKKVINDANCGLCGEAENANQLAENVMQMLNRNDYLSMGKNSYQYYTQNFTKERFIRKLLDYLR